jgi:hypothetical protein
MSTRGLADQVQTGHGRRIFLEALIVSVLGHAIFFSVFIVKESERPGGAWRRPALISIALTESPDGALTDATRDPAAAQLDLPERAELLDRRTAVPKLELDRTTLVWEDEPELAAPTPPTVGPESWGFTKEPARLRDRFPADYDVGPSLATAQERLADGGEGLQREIEFTFAFRKMPGAGTLMLGPDEAGGDDVKLFRCQFRLDLGTGKLDYVVRPSGDPQIDAEVMSRMRRWELKLERSQQGTTLRARLPLPAWMRRHTPSRTPPSADELLGDEPEGAPS